MKYSKIEWTTHTFNPWSGCTKVSEACAHCYAEALANRTNTLGGWGKGAPRRRTKPEYWRQPLRWNAAAAALGERPRVFCASLADWLDDDGVPIEWLADLLLLIGQTPNLDWLLLTKRPGNWKGRVRDAAKVLCERGQDYGWVESWLAAADSPMAGEAPRNVWLGTTVENQNRADERIPQLLAIPARVRFLSCEPLLGPVHLTPWIDPVGVRCMDSCSDPTWVDPRKIETWKDRTGEVFPRCPDCGAVSEWTAYDPTGIHWVICGGESGHGARPMHPEWAQSLRDQCVGASVPFLFKQWGDWLPLQQGTAYMDAKAPASVVANGPGATGWAVYRVGKKAAGRELDGREWNQFPETTITS